MLRSTRFASGAMSVALALLATLASRASEEPVRSPIAAATPAADPSAPTDADHWRVELVAALRAQRATLGMAAVEPSAALDRAAQAQAEEMASGGWFDFTSPSGLTVEARVAATGYNAALVAAKLSRAPLAEGPEALAARFAMETDNSRQSLFHSGVREVGVGIATTAGERLVVFVLANRPHPDDLPPSLGPDLEARRAAFLAAANAGRAERGLPPLRPDAALDRAAQEHATALLAALRAGKPPGAVADLASRIGRNAAGNPAIMAVGKGNAGGSASYTDKTPGRQGNRGTLGQATVVDAMSAARAVAAAAREPGAALVAGYARLGVGVAIEMDGAAPHVVWVACLMR